MGGCPDRLPVNDISREVISSDCGSRTTGSRDEDDTYQLSNLLNYSFISDEDGVLRSSIAAGGDTEEASGLSSNQSEYSHMLSVHRRIGRSSASTKSAYVSLSEYYNQMSP